MSANEAAGARVAADLLGHRLDADQGKNRTDLDVLRELMVYCRREERD